MEIQKNLGSDIVMCFDECPALPPDDEVARAMRLSMRWAERSKEAFGDRPGHALFGIQQGGVTRELARRKRRETKGNRLRRLRGRRARRGRGAGGDVRRARLCARHAARGQAALPDGRGQARRYRRRGQARDRHDGLRAAVALGPDGAGLHPARRGQHQERAPRRRPAGRSTRPAPVPPAAAIHAPICTTCSGPERSSRPCC
jgi:hypothetical protein